MTQRDISRLVTIAIALVVIGAATIASSVHSPAFAEGTSSAQDSSLLAALVALGGGSESFNAKTLREKLSAGSNEDVKLRSTVGDASVAQFDDVFTFVVRDGLASISQSGASLPAPSPNPSNPKVVAAALFRAGVHDGKFDVERLFDVLFAQNVHLHAMMRVGQKYGASGMSAYHTVLAHLVADIGSDGTPIEADDHTGHMQMHGSSY
jgi:hypothetical protein